MERWEVLLNKRNLTKNEAKELNMLFNNILPDCYCDREARELLQHMIKKRIGRI